MTLLDIKARRSSSIIAEMRTANTEALAPVTEALRAYLNERQEAVAVNDYKPGRSKAFPGNKSRMGTEPRWGRNTALDAMATEYSGVEGVFTLSGTRHASTTPAVTETEDAATVQAYFTDSIKSYFEAACFESDVSIKAPIRLGHWDKPVGNGGTPRAKTVGWYWDSVANKNKPYRVEESFFNEIPIGEGSGGVDWYCVYKSPEFLFTGWSKSKVLNASGGRTAIGATEIENPGSFSGTTNGRPDALSGGNDCRSWYGAACFPYRFGPAKPVEYMGEAVRAPKARGYRSGAYMATDEREGL